MKRLRVALAAIFAGAWAALALTVTKGTVYTRGSGANYPDPLSGITYAGGNAYYTVADNGAAVRGLYPCTIQLSADGRTVSSFQIVTTNNAVKPSGTSDIEGVAYDPSTGNVWIADESKKTIKEYDPATGAVVQSLDIPSVMTKNRNNYGFESLTISGDGLTLWTCNEEALTCDGDRSSYTSTTTVRLCKYTRATVKENFSFAGMYPYTTEKWTYQYDYSDKARCGVADLCALPDGSLLVLERELSFSSTSAFAIALGANILGWKLYHVADPSGATDVQDCPSLTNAVWTAVGKSLLASDGASLTSYGNFEGICLGPRLSDSTVSVLLISDSGDGYSQRKILPLVLSGLNVRTLDFAEPARGTASITGSNYRYLNGATVDVSLAGGIQTPPTAYTNNAAAFTDVGWTAPGQSPASGAGETAAFAVASDGTFAWTFADGVAATPVVGNDSFESCQIGTGASDLAGWSGDGTVQAGTPALPAVGYPMPNETHEKVLSVDGTVTRTYSATTNGNQRLEMMLSVRRSPDDELAVPEGDNQVAVAVDKDGYLNVYRRTGPNACGWARLSETQYQNGQWVRVGLYFDYDRAGGASVLVKLDGAECGWHLMPNGGASRKVSSFTVSGATQVDDVLLTMTHFTNDWPVVVVDTVPPAAWFDRYGITGDARVPGARAANGYTMLESYTAGLDPTSSALFRITGIKILPDDRLQLTLNSVRDDLSGEELTSLFSIVRSAALGGEETTVPGSAVAGDGCTVWTSAAPVAGDKAFYRVKVVVPNE
ncbi:MAG: esterase-like activity of phytase family protein [Kiritimatiellae bacterium]|nr:esterase-like activity of phytase family protein [Kiritimatiellia bacterium]